jgi:hypothetical protein
LPGAGSGDGAVEDAQEPNDQPHHGLRVEAGVLCRRIHPENQSVNKLDSGMFNIVRPPALAHPTVMKNSTKQNVLKSVFSRRLDVERGGGVNCDLNVFFSAF